MTREATNWANKLGLETNIQNGDFSQEYIEPTEEVQLDVEQIQEACKESLDFLAAFAIPQMFEYMFPLVFQAAWSWLRSYVHRIRDFSQLALGIPRGFAKTTFIKIFILYIILYTKKGFILVCCNSQPKANAIIADVMDMLNEPNVKKVFGDWNIGKEVDNQTMKKFGFRGRDIVLYASTVSAVRGINIKHLRPDVMIFDDIQSREDADSEATSKQIETDMVGTAMKAKSPKGCLFVFIGNMYPTKHSILRKIKTNENWLKFIAGGVVTNPDGTIESLWEDLQPLEQLKREFTNDLKAGHPEIFYAEVLNDENASVNHLLDLSAIPAYDIDDTEIHQGNFVIIDPSSDKKDSDLVTVMYFEVHNTVPVCKWLKEGKFSPGQTIDIALEIMLLKRCGVCGIESVMSQYTYLYWFNAICQQRGIQGLQPVELLPGMISKPARIMSMFKSYLTGELKVHPSCVPIVHPQVVQYNPLKRDNVDGILDCLAYAPIMMNTYGGLILMGAIVEMQEIANIPVRSIEYNSAF